MNKIGHGHGHVYEIKSYILLLVVNVNVPVPLPDLHLLFTNYPELTLINIFNM